METTQQSSSTNRVGAVCAVVGSLLLFIGTYLHPMGADPNQAPAAFAEYAADRLRVASHLTHLAGVALMVAALLLLAQQLERGSGAAWTRAPGAVGTAVRDLPAGLAAV